MSRVDKRMHRLDMQKRRRRGKKIIRSKYIANIRHASLWFVKYAYIYSYIDSLGFEIRRLVTLSDIRLIKNHDLAKKLKNAGNKKSRQKDKKA